LTHRGSLQDIQKQSQTRLGKSREKGGRKILT